MRKASKLLLSTALLATFAGGVVVPVVGTLGGSTIVWAEGETTTDKTKIPDETTVTIHKLVGISFGDPIENKDGTELTTDKIKELLDPDGNRKVTTLDGVNFVAYKITQLPKDDEAKSKALTALKGAKTVDDLLKAAQENNVTLGEKFDIGTTADGGKVNWKVAKGDYGEYVVIESGAPANVSSAVAVPFIASFPMALSDGTGYLDTVHVYPKNIQGDVPKPGKDVEKIGNDDGSYKIGDDIDFILKGSIPTNIQDYEVYNLVDEFDTQLSPDISSVTAKFGTTDLVKETDFKVTQTEGEGGKKKVTVALTEEGLEKLATVGLEKRDLAIVDGEGETENSAEKPFVEVHIKAKINDTAKLITDIGNKTHIEYDNKKDGHKEEKPKPTDPSEEVKVYTGGHTFVKVDATDVKVTLKGAEFELLDADGQAVKWTDELIAANKATSDNAGQYVAPAAGQPIKFKSDENGRFTISGLAYGTEVTKRNPDGTVKETATSAKNRSYQLRETKAPEGYVVPSSLISFEIAPSSTTDVEATALFKADASDRDKKVENNKRPSIPQTGGIGSAIFILAGLGSMLFAGLGLKKRKNQA